MLELLNTQQGRKQVIDYIESKDNLGRKNESFKQSEIYNDRIKPYVINELREQFQEQTVIEMPLVKSVNIAKRCVNNQAIIYNEAPERDWSDLTDEQKEVLWSVYHDMKINKKLGVSNKFYKLHTQCLLQILPKDKKLIMRVLHPHQWDAIPSVDDPEIADAIIISAYDKTDSIDISLVGTPTGNRQLAEQNTANYERNAAMREREKQSKKRYVVWTREFNYIMNGSGEIEGEVLENPIGELPFVEISGEKDFEYWVRQASSYTDFTAEFNSALSETRQTVKMQSFAVAIVKAPKEMQFNNLQIGPNYLLHLPLDKNAGVETEFEFASPSANIEGAIKFLEVMLSGFLTSNGIDPKTVSMSGESQTYTSGIDRLLALIDKMQASKEDYDTYQWVESKVFDLIKLWLSVLNGTETLDPKYYVSIPESSQVFVKFHEPEMVQTEVDKIDLYSKKIELGIASPITALMELEELSREDAVKKYTEIQKDLLIGSSQKTEVFTDGSEPGDQPN